MSCETPRRISLRRKRLVNEDKEGNQLKKRSPSLDSPSKQTHPPSSSFDGNIPNEIQKKTYPASSQTPKNLSKEERKNEIPVSSKDSVVKPFPQLSPTSPFSLSQMPSTQDCEVVWDCNSPGYSKEDLKKMFNNSGEKSTPSPVPPFLNQHIASRFRPPVHLATRKGSNASTTVSAALDDLLTKVNGENTNSLANDQSSEDETSSACLNSSSQPFDVSAAEAEPNFSFSQTELGGESACEDHNEILSLKPNSSEEFEITTDERSKAIFTSGNSPDTGGHVPLVAVATNSKSPNGISKGVSAKDGGGNDSVVNVSSSSINDDLFSESFLIATQAFEDELYKQETQKLNTPSTLTKAHHSVSPLSRIRKRKPVVLFPDLAKEQVGSLSSDKRLSKDCNKLDATIKFDEQLVNPVRANVKDERFSLQTRRVAESIQHVKENRESNTSKDSIEVGPCESITSNKVVDHAGWKPVPKQAGMRASFQLGKSSFNAQTQQKVYKESNNSVCKAKPICKEVQSEKMVNEFSCKQLHPRQHQEEKQMSQITNVPKNCPMTKNWKEIETKTSSKQRLSHSKCSNTAQTIQSHSMKCSFQNSQELEEDEDDFAALIPSLVEAEALHSRGIASQSVRNKMEGDRTGSLLSGGSIINSENTYASSKDVTEFGNTLNFALSNKNQGSSGTYYTNTNKTTFNPKSKNGENGNSCVKKSTLVTRNSGTSKNVNTVNAGSNDIKGCIKKSTKAAFNEEITGNLKNSIVYGKNTSNNNNFTNQFKRPLFAPSFNNSNKPVDGSNYTSINKAALGSFSRLPQKETKIIITDVETRNSASVRPSSVTDNTKSKIHPKLPNLQNTANSPREDDGFGDDDDLFLQKEVLESISLVESRYMASQTQKKYFESDRVGCEKEELILPSGPSQKITSSPVFPNSDSTSQLNCRVKASNSPNVTKGETNSLSFGGEKCATKSAFHCLGGINTLNKRLTNTPSGLSTPLAGPSSQNARQTLSRHPSKNGQILPSTEEVKLEVNYDRVKLEGFSSQNALIEKEQISDEDLLSLAFEEDPFEEAFINETLRKAAESGLPSPDFGKPFKPPSFTNTERVCHREKENQNVSKFPYSKSAPTKPPSNSVINSLLFDTTSKLSTNRSNPFTRFNTNKCSSDRTHNEPNNTIRRFSRTENINPGQSSTDVRRPTANKWLSNFTTKESFHKSGLADSSNSTKSALHGNMKYKHVSNN